jgi:hypothetical protein
LSPLNVAAAPAPQTVPTISAGSPAQIVNDIYQAELGRPAEAAAIAYGSAILNGGKVTAADFAQQVRNSPEAQARRNSFPSQDAATIPAPAATAPVENFGMTPTIGAPATTPTIGPTFAPTIAPTQVPTIAAPPAVQATSPASSTVSPYGFSMSNVSTGFGAIPQTFGSYYGPSAGSTSNLGLDLPAAPSNPVGDFNFSGANVGGFDVNAPGLGASPQAPADGFAMQQGSGYNPQASQNAYLDSQIKNANAANNALDSFNAAITPVGQAPLRAGQFVSSTGDPGLYQNASDYNIQTMVLNQQALAQKPAAVIAAKPVVVPKVAQGAFAPVPFYGRW